MNLFHKSLLACFVAMAASGASAQFTPGNLVVLRVGDGSAALTNASTAQFLDEYTPAGVFVQTVALPIAISGGNRPVTASGTATSEGQLTTAFNGKYFVAVGYDAAPGVSGIAGSAAATTNRVIARITYNGTVDSSTRINDAFSGNNIRSGYTVNGSSFYAVGAVTGVVEVPLGNTGASTVIANNLTNIRVVSGFNGQLYASSASSTFRFATVGTGFPTGTGNTITNLPGFSTASTSPYAVVFGSVNRIFASDDRAVASGGGVLQYDFDGTNWSLASTISTGLTVGTRGVAINNTTTTLYAVETNGAVRALDLTNLAGGFGSALITQATNTANRSIQVVPEYQPRVTSLVANSANSLTIGFSEPVNAAAATAANYTLSGPGQGTASANPTSVVNNGNNTYTLTFSGAMINGSSVTVTVGAPVQDQFGYGLSASANSASVTAVPVSMSEFSVE